MCDYALLGGEPDVPQKPSDYGKLEFAKEMIALVDNKAWYASKTVWGGVMALVAAIAGLLGHAIDAGTQSELVDCVTAGGAAVGSIVAIYGRIVAKKKI